MGDGIMVVRHRERRFKLVKEIGDKMKKVSDPIEVLMQLARMKEIADGKQTPSLHARLLNKLTGKRRFGVGEAEELLKNWFSSRYGLDFTKVPKDLQTYYVLWGAFKVLYNYGSIPKPRDVQHVVREYFDGSPIAQKKVENFLRYLYKMTR